MRETITYDFGVVPRHGIYRDIRARVPWDGKDNYDRVWPIDVISVTATDASADYEVSEEGDDVRIKIGDPDRTVTGQHTYEITYRARGAYNAFDTHDELVWNVIGVAWPVPIESATAVVHTPDGITDVACFTGYYGSFSPCGSASADGSTATFTAPQSGLGPYQGMTVTVGMPKGSVPEPVPILEERFNLASAFRATPATVGHLRRLARRARRRRVRA